MNVTQPAATQHVPTLERHLGKKLLKRHGRGVEAAAANRHPTSIRVTTSPSFAAFWLVPHRRCRHTAWSPGHPRNTAIHKRN